MRRGVIMKNVYNSERFCNKKYFFKCFEWDRIKIFNFERIYKEEIDNIEIIL
jgi:hypothetical protein